MSYAREDIQWAEDQARSHSMGGAEVYLDVKSNRAGDNWQERIYHALAHADKVRLGWSRHAKESDWVKREYTEALRLARKHRRKRFLLIDLLDDTPLPSELAHIQAHRWLFARRGSDRLLTEPYRDRDRPPDWPQQPSLLLRPEYRVVRFQGRKELLERTLAWCAAEPLFDLVLKVGPGGSGKTRLFAEVCARMAPQGWECGFLEGDRMREAMRDAPDRIDRLLQPGCPSLIVIDYAESRRDEIVEVLRRAARKASGPPVRVVLLARNAGDWWSEVLQDHAEIRVLLGGTAEPSRIAPLATDTRQRRTAYGNAVRAFARTLGTPVPERSLGPRLDAPHLGHALFIHLAALLHVRGETPDSGPADLLTRLLEHEKKYWRGVADKVGLEKRLKHLVSPAVALVTLVGGVNQGEELNALLKRHPLLSDQTALDRWLIGEVLGDLYGWEGRIEALQPDRLGEALVAQELERHPALRESWYVGATPAQLRQGLVVLGRIAAEREKARVWLVDTLARELGGLAETALQVALESEYVARALTEAFQRRPNPHLAWALESKLPDETVMLRELAVEMTRQALDVKSNPPEHAAMLSSLADRLRALERYKEAFPPALESTEIRRTLAESDPQRFRPRLATSLTLLAAVYRGMGLYDDALVAADEAVSIRRSLAEGNPSILPRLATSLNSRGITLRYLGRFQEALAAMRESGRLRRRLSPEDPSYPDLATSLVCMATTLRELDRLGPALSAARESVRIRRRFAEKNPDRYLIKLAESLDVLGTIYRAQGRRRQAATAYKEAIDIYTRLSDIYPDVFLPMLSAARESVDAGEP